MNTDPADERFISEPILPASKAIDTSAMSRGEPGLPEAFEWRGEVYHVTARLEQWKATAHEGGAEKGNVYLRRHYYRLRMSDGNTWTVYFVRQTPKSGSVKSRWFLYTIDRESHAIDRPS